MLRPEELEVKLLEEQHLKEIEFFSSGVCKELEAFLKENAWREQNIGYSKTYLFFHNKKIIGYVTLLNDNQKLTSKGLNPSLLKFIPKTDQEYSSVPALKLGRMCVTDDYNSQLENAHYKGTGSIIFAFVVNIAKNSPAGCRVITTHAKKVTNAYLWYTKLGFCYSHSDDKTKDILAREDYDSVPMFYDLHRIIV